jgi:predicted CXXCH cytochrome family protein
MRGINARRLIGLLALGLAGAINSACNDIVYRDRDPFEQPVAGAGDFLGYSNAADKKTTCGNCHVGKQAEWSGTAHASAWTTLSATPGRQPSCEGCHTISSRGNLVTTENVGWVATKHERYQDVQCESCHGPGLTHVVNPDVAANKPLASINAGVDLTLGCGECHSGAHQPFVEEWSKSRHARVIVSRSTNPSCVGCHDAKGVLQAWGVKTNFIEANKTEYMGITCAVCHDPHDARNPGQLRFPMDVAAVESNLCMKCHLRRAQPDPASSAGPHSPQGPLLLGEAGWFPPNFQYPPGALVGSHGTDRNPKLCATCHVNNYEVNDKLTGNFAFRATGHSFQPTPCVDAQGIPTGSTTCDIAERSFRACTTCHLTESAARTALTVARARLERLAGEIAGLLPRIPSSEFSTTDNRISTGEGSRFNMQLAQEKGSPAHNPFLVEALLLASIRQIELDYGLKPSAALVMQAQLAPPGR